jgi:hypothetical protein
MQQIFSNQQRTFDFTFDAGIAWSGMLFAEIGRYKVSLESKC